LEIVGKSSYLKNINRVPPTQYCIMIKSYIYRRMYFTLQFIKATVAYVTKMLSKSLF